jgi:autotransporter-associated beta strand protein
MIRFKTRPAIALAAITAIFGVEKSLQAAGVSTTWNNAGTSWNGLSNWSLLPPTALTSGALPAVASSGIVNPDTGASLVTALGLSIDDSGTGKYTVNGTGGTISLGASGLSVIGSGTATINPSVLLTLPQSFAIGDGATALLKGPLDSLASALSKDGNGTVIFSSAAGTQILQNTVAVNAGTAVVTNPNALGQAPQITVNNGAAFEIDLPSPATAEMDFGDAQTHLTLNNGATLRGGGNTSYAVGMKGGNSSPSITNGANVTIQMPQTQNFLVLYSAVHDTTSAPTGTNSVINVTGGGELELTADSTGNLAYTGGWNINHTVSGSSSGLTFLESPLSLGYNSTTGYAAPVTLTRGYLCDSSSTQSTPIPNPITMNGGLLTANLANATTQRPASFWTGTMTLQQPSDVYLGDVTVANGHNLEMDWEGVVTGNSTLDVYAAPLFVIPSPPAAAALNLLNTSTTTPNTVNGNFIVHYNAQLRASTSASGSDPLGTSSVTLSGGELQLNHAGDISGTDVTAFANNNLTIKGLSFLDSNGTLTVGRGTSTNTNKTLVLGSLTFDTSGGMNSQTFTVQQADASANYGVRFGGVTTLAGNATIAGGAVPADVTLSGAVTGSGNLIKAGGNTLTLSGASSNYTGSTTVNAGTLAFNVSESIATLTVNDTANAVVAAGRNKLLKASVISTVGSGNLNLNDNDAIFTATSAASVGTLIANGYSHGTWTGPGINSFSAHVAATSPGVVKTALGYAKASQVNLSHLDGASVNPTDTLVRYTVLGDANLDGTVNALDFNALATNYGAASQSWVQGDFNYDGTVNSADFADLAASYGQSIAAESGAIASSPASMESMDSTLGSVVPEPASGLILFLASGGLLCRRRK